MNLSALRRPTSLAFAAIALFALAYTVWLSSALMTSGRDTQGGPSDTGPGVFLLIYAALPTLITSLSLGYLLARPRSRRLGLACAALGAVLSVIQVLWLADLALRLLVSPPTLALLAIVAVITTTLATARTALSEDGALAART